MGGNLLTLSQMETLSPFSQELWTHISWEAACRLSWSCQLDTRRPRPLVHRHVSPPQPLTRLTQKQRGPDLTPFGISPILSLCLPPSCLIITPNITPSRSLFSSNYLHTVFHFLSSPLLYLLSDLPDLSLFPLDPPRQDKQNSIYPLPLYWMFISFISLP